MIDYSKAKPSLFVEDQLPSFVKSEGPIFIDFLKTYYDWLERRIVLLNLRANNPITEDQLSLEQKVSSMGFFLITEESNETDSFLIGDESEIEEELYGNNLSLSYDGWSTYMHVNAPVLSPSSDWTIGLWFQISEYASVVGHDLDVITLSDGDYISLATISFLDNKIYGYIGDDTVVTDFYMNKGEWYYLVIRYDSVNKNIFYNLLDQYDNNRTYVQSIDLSIFPINIFNLGVDLYSSADTGNFFIGSIDQSSVWNKVLDDEEIPALYNEGTPFDIRNNHLDYISSASLTDFWVFENGSDETAPNDINPLHDGYLFGGIRYTYDVPFNLKTLITEIVTELSGTNIYNNTLLLKIISFLKYSGTDNVPNSIKMLCFAEHISGKLEEDQVILSTSNNTISIDSFMEAKNPIYAINNIGNIQDIDYNFNYNNFVSDKYFQYQLAEIMSGFPIYLSDKHDTTIKSLIGKTIRDFYQSKGTISSIKYFFQILYNEEVNVEMLDTFHYVIKTLRFNSKETKDIYKAVAHPLGYIVDYDIPVMIEP